MTGKLDGEQHNLETRLSSIDAFGSLAAMIDDPTVKAGRYSMQKEAERHIFGDILPKLRPQPHHRLLDIGCGAGLIAVPMASCVREVIGLDHPLVVAPLVAQFRLPNLRFVGGSFPEADIDGEFDIIVAYSVVQCLPDMDSVLSFCRAAAARLAKGGRLLIGDLPNLDKKARFRGSDAGKAFEAEWARSMEQQPPLAGESEAFEMLARSDLIGAFTDHQILSIAAAARNEGLDAWVMPQSPLLPFGNTREDLIIARL